MEQFLIDYIGEEILEAELNNEYVYTNEEKLIFTKNYINNNKEDKNCEEFTKLVKKYRNRNKVKF